MALEQRNYSLPPEHPHKKKKRKVSQKQKPKKADGRKSDQRMPSSDGNEVSDITTNDLKNEMNSGQSNVLVAVRVRPLLRKEVENGSRDIIKVMDGKMVVVLDPGVSSDDVLRLNRNREKRY